MNYGSAATRWEASTLQAGAPVYDAKETYDASKRYPLAQYSVAESDEEVWPRPTQRADPCAERLGARSAGV